MILVLGLRVQGILGLKVCDFALKVYLSPINTLGCSG